MSKPGLSDITKEYLSSFLEESMPKTELSDFSRAYMIKLDGYNMNDERPTLSGLTKEFLREKVGRYGILCVPLHAKSYSVFFHRSQ